MPYPAPISHRMKWLLAAFYLGASKTLRPLDGLDLKSGPFFIRFHTVLRVSASDPRNMIRNLRWKETRGEVSGGNLSTQG